MKHCPNSNNTIYIYTYIYAYGLVGGYDNVYQGDYVVV